jgi:potassium/hydrogen antiporter
MILIISFIIIFIVITALFSNKLNIPVIMIALFVGIIFGSDISGFVYFDNSEFVKNFSDIVLVFVLFAGGFDLKSDKLKKIIKPSITLATIGVFLTALITTLLFHFIFKWTLIESFLLASIISSTDAAAVFSILKNKTISNKVGAITEVESAANDPMAIIMTTFIVKLMAGNTNIPIYSVLFSFIWQLLGGAFIGYIVGIISFFMLKRILKLYKEYIFLFLIGIILLSYGLAIFCHASGPLSAFFCGIYLGNKKFPLKNGISSFVETISFITNVFLFILLGLLVFPKEFLNIWPFSVGLFIIITFISRPICVFLCTLKWKLNLKENIFLSWSGIRGAVPIILAIYPLSAGLEKGNNIFNIIFLTVIISIVVQGTTIGKLADYFNFSKLVKHKPLQTMELVTVVDTDYELLQIYLDEDFYNGKVKISALNLPSDTTITMITRNGKILAPTGKTFISSGDTLSILTKAREVEPILEEFSSKLKKQLE